jgi:hypothetical protein
LNLFIAVVVDAMQRSHSEEMENKKDNLDEINKKLDAIVTKLNAEKSSEG